MAFYNASDSVYEFQTPLEVLELGGKVKVRDLVKRQDLKRVKDVCHYLVQPHSVLLCRMEAKTRLEPQVYEAEWAYLPCYNDLCRKSKPILYVASDACSGGMKVHQLGDREENTAQWDEVYSEKGGAYEMTIHYTCADRRKLELWVNGKYYALDQLASGGDDKVSTITLSVHLQPGNNLIKMGNRYGWAPDIDKFTLTKQ